MQNMQNGGSSGPSGRPGMQRQMTRQVTIKEMHVAQQPSSAKSSSACAIM